MTVALNTKLQRGALTEAPDVVLVPKERQMAHPGNAVHQQHLLQKNNFLRAHVPAKLYPSTNPMGSQEGQPRAEAFLWTWTQRGGQHVRRNISP